MVDIKYCRREIPRLLYEMQKHLPSAFFNAQEHYLIHQVEEIELCGPVHSMSMWMVERHLKFMKGLVRQLAHPEGYMMEGYTIYQNMLYASEYLPILASNLNLRHICDIDSNKKFEGEQLKRKARLRKLKGNYYLVDVYYIVHILIVFYSYCFN